MTETALPAARLPWRILSAPCVPILSNTFCTGSQTDEKNHPRHCLRPRHVRALFAQWRSGGAWLRQQNRGRQPLRQHFFLFLFVGEAAEGQGEKKQGQKIQTQPARARTIHAQQSLPQHGAAPRRLPGLSRRSHQTPGLRRRGCGLEHAMAARKRKSAQRRHGVQKTIRNTAPARRMTTLP